MKSKRKLTDMEVYDIGTVIFGVATFVIGGCFILANIYLI